MRRFRWWAIVIVLAAGAGALTLARAADEEDYGAEMRANAFSALEVLGHGFLAPSAAVDKARGAAKGVPSEIELAVLAEKESRFVVWEVELDAGAAIHKVAVDARSGEVRKVWDDAEDADDAGKAAKLLEGKMTDLKAALDALSPLGPGLVLGVQVEDDDGTAVFDAYAIRDGRMKEFQVDASTGKVKAKGDEKSGEGKEGGEGDGD
jgi:uncharacterized membrane protein YkoI